MVEQANEAQIAAFDGAGYATTKDLIAAIKVKALLEFSRSNPEFHQELSLNAAKAARFRGVDLDDTELELLARAFGQRQS